MDSPYQHFLGSNYEPNQNVTDIAPVWKLTVDIVENIFLACLPSERNPNITVTEAPLLLTRICSSWRQLALSSPRIWAAIHIVLPNVCSPEDLPAEITWFIKQLEDVSRAVKRHEVAVSEWLGRSGACPLSIYIYQQNPFIGIDEGTTFYNADLEDLHKQHLSFIMKTIIPHHKRWCDFDIFLNDDTLNGILDVGLNKNDLKAFKALHITRKPCFYEHRRERHYGHWRQSRWKDVIELLPSRATSASFEGITVHSTDIPLMPQQSWSGLTELYLSLSETLSWSGEPAIVAVNVAAEVLCHCQALVKLTLFIYCYEGDNTPGQQGSDIITLQHLRTLHISLPLSPSGLTFAKRLRFPSLTELSVEPPSFLHKMEEAV